MVCRCEPCPSSRAGSLCSNPATCHHPPRIGKCVASWEAGEATGVPQTGRILGQGSWILQVYRSYLTFLSLCLHLCEMGAS